jgi:hypothetical protein
MALYCWRAQRYMLGERVIPEPGSCLDDHVKAAEGNNQACASEVARSGEVAGNTSSTKEQRQLDGWRHRYVAVGQTYHQEYRPWLSSAGVRGLALNNSRFSSMPDGPRTRVVNGER